MQGSIYELAILLSLKDMASGGLIRAEGQVRSFGKEGRATLQTFQDLRASLQKDLAIAGVGVGMLAVMKKGVDVAGDFEAAMADLRMSIAQVGKDGKTDLSALAGELNRYEALGMRLGNTLPGSTRDFIQMFSVLKQGGLSSKTILEGTGQAVANLAVVTGSVPADLAEPFSQYAQQFQLTGEEATKLSDTLARLRFATGLRPQELIEGSKFFQLRAGMTLGLSGLSGAEISGRLLATLKTFGLEGGVGGRELGSFMVGLTFNTKEQQKALAELKKKGIEMQFFDKKGGFLGVDNVFAQMEKLRTLSTEERTRFGEQLFSRETLGIMNAMMQSGVAGWQRINQRIDQVAPSQELLNQKTATYNAKLEAVQGTITNLTATAFLPMLDTLKPILDTSNAVVGSLQGWTKAHPGIAKTGTQFVGVTSAALALTFAIKGGITTWGLYRLASTAALKSLQGELLLTGAAADVAAVKAGRLNTMVTGMGKMSALKITVALVAVGAGWELISWLKEEQGKYQEELAKRQQQVSATYEDAMRRRQLFGRRTQEPEARETHERLARESWAQVSEEIFRGGMGILQGLISDDQRHFAPGQAAPKFAEDFRRQTALHDPNVLAKLISQAQRGELVGVKSAEEIESFMNVLKEAFGGEKVKMAQEIAVLDLMNLSKSSQEAALNLNNISSWFGPANQIPNAFQRAADSANRFSFRMNSVQPPTFDFGSRPPSRPSFDFGGPKINTQPTHRFGRSIFQSEPRSQIKDEVLRTIAQSEGGRGPSVHHHGETHVNVNVPPGSPAANDGRELARLIAREIAIQKERA